MPKNTIIIFNIPLFSTYKILCPFPHFAVPAPTITLERNHKGSLLNAGDSENFTCRVVVHRDVDISVNVSLIWIREFHQSRSVIHATENITLTDSQKTFESNTCFKNLTSLDERVFCKSVLYPSEGTYIDRSEESNQTVILNVTGMGRII